MTASSTSALLRLPLELRLSIYQFALSRGGEDLPSRKSLALLHTCRQVYIEARLIPFSCITVSLGPCSDDEDNAALGIPSAVQLLRCLLPWQRRAVSLEVLSIFPIFTAEFRSNWCTFCTLCNEAGLRLKALSVTACHQSVGSFFEPVLEELPPIRFSVLLLHPRLVVTYRCTKSASPLPDAWVEMLESMGAHPKADTERESGGNISIKMLVSAWDTDGNRPYRFLSAKGVPADSPAWRSRYVQLVPEFKVLQADW